MSRHKIPRAPAGKEDVYFPMRDTAHLLDSIVTESGAVPLVSGREEIPETADERPEKRTSALERKVDDLVSCLNKLTKAVSGR